MSYIEFKGICKNYGYNEVLKSVDLNIKKGELITLLGPSGCGKSTLLRCLAGLEEVSKGSILLDSKDITNVDTTKRHIGMVFQKYSLFPNMTVAENIGFGLKIQKVDKKTIAEKTAKMIEIVGLQGRENHYPNQLSGGQQQRVALARAIITEPKVLLLDEPLSAIDALLRKNLQTQIRNIVKKLGITTIFVTHDQDEAMIMSDRVFLFNNGRIEQSGTPVEMYTSPKTHFAASFMGNYNIVETDKFFNLVVKNTANLSNWKFNSEFLAIRPEVIELLAKKPELEDENHVSFKVKIEDSVPHGNVLRYTLKTENDLILKSEVLFRSFTLFNVGDEIFVTIDKKNCLEIDK